MLFSTQAEQYVIAIVSDLAPAITLSGAQEMCRDEQVRFEKLSDQKALLVNLPAAADVQLWRDSVRAAIDAGVCRFVFLSAAQPTPSTGAAAGVILTDHINLSGKNPLVGQNDERYGPRFPDVTKMYDKTVIEPLCESARPFGLTLIPGLALAPADPALLSELEKKVIEQNSVAATCGSVVGAALTAAHAGCRATTILFIHRPPNDKMGAWLLNLIDQLSVR